MIEMDREFRVNIYFYINIIKDISKIHEFSNKNDLINN
jgi:hypothetical protein